MLISPVQLLRCWRCGIGAGDALVERDVCYVPRMHPSCNAFRQHHHFNSCKIDLKIESDDPVNCVNTWSFFHTPSSSDAGYATGADAGTGTHCSRELVTSCDVHRATTPSSRQIDLIIEWDGPVNYFYASCCFQLVTLCWRCVGGGCRAASPATIRLSVRRHASMRRRMLRLASLSHTDGGDGGPPSSSSSRRLGWRYCDMSALGVPIDDLDMIRTILVFSVAPMFIRWP